MNIKSLLGRAVKTAAASVMLFTSVSHAQGVHYQQIFLDDGHGKITTINTTLGGTGTFTFPTGAGGTILTNSGTGVLNLAGNFTTTGAFGLQFNLAGPTTLGLPTGPGTLMINPMTAVGDIIYASVAGTPATPAALPVGASPDGDVLTLASGIPSWQAVVNSIQGSANEVLVNSNSGLNTTGAGIVLTLPQPISKDATPTFQTITLGDATHIGIVALSNEVSSSFTSFEAASGAPNLIYTLPATAPGAGEYLEATNNTGTLTWNTPAGGVTGSGFTTNGVAYGTGSSAIATTAALTNGQLLVGSTGVAPVPATLGTSNGVTTATGAGTLSIGLGAITPTSVTAQPTTNVASAVIEQTTAATPSADIFDVTASNGTTKYISTSSAGVTTIAGTIQGSVSGSSGSTTGNAATATTLQTARNIAGTSFDGSANIELANKFIVQGTSDAGLSGAQFLGALGNGLLKNTTSTGVLSIATAGTDYLATVNASAPFSGSGTTGSPLTIATATSSALGVVEVDGSSIIITGGKISATASAPSFSTITGGTNTSGAAMIVGNTSSLSATGSGTITATAVPFSGVSAATNTNALVIGTGGSLGTSGTGTITATSAASATDVATTAVTTNQTYFPLFVASASNGNQAASLDATGLGYNPSTNTLTIGVASSATGSIALGNSGGAALTTLQGAAAGTAETYNMPDTGISGNTLAYTSNTSGYPALTFAEKYATARTAITTAGTFQATGASVTLSPGVWLVTSETTMSSAGTNGTYYNYAVTLGTSTTTSYTEGEAQSRYNTGNNSAVTISLSKVVTITTSTTVQTYATADNTSCFIDISNPTYSATAGTCTGIHAMRIK